MKKPHRGTSIIEIVVAAALISMAVIAALSLANHSQKQNSYARGLAEATKYTTQAADWIRTQRNTLGWATIASVPANDTTYCLNALPAEFTEIVAGSCDTSDYIPDTTFQRTITLNQNAGTIIVTIVVAWQENIPRQATIEMELTEW
jgi:Tfp pilus assembly protein PilV